MGPVVKPVGAETEVQAEEGVIVMTVRAGQEAPDFQARAFVDGGFKEVKLSDYQGR